MTPRTYFRLSLLAPLLLPLLALPLGVNAVFAVLMLSLVFGGAQYAIFALCLFVAIGRLRSTSRILRLVYWSPILFVPIQALGWLAYCAFERHRHPELSGGWEELLPGAVYSLLVGYGYALVVHAGFALLEKLGRVHSTSLGES